MSITNTIYLEAKASPIDAKSKSLVRIKRGDDLNILIAIFDGENLAQNLSEIQKLKLEIFDIGKYNTPMPRASKILLSKEILSDEINQNLALEDWKERLSYHAKFCLDRIETTLESGEKWIKISAINNDSKISTLSGGWIEIEENFSSETEYSLPDAVQVRDEILDSKNSAKEQADIAREQANIAISKVEEANFISSQATQLLENTVTNIAESNQFALDAKNYADLANASKNMATESATLAQNIFNETLLLKDSSMESANICTQKLQDVLTERQNCSNIKKDCDSIKNYVESIANNLTYKGTYSDSSAPKNPNVGDFYVISASCAFSSIPWTTGDVALYNGSVWQKVSIDTIVQEVKYFEAAGNAQLREGFKTSNPPSNSTYGQIINSQPITVSTNFTFALKFKQDPVQDWSLLGGTNIGLATHTSYGAAQYALMALMMSFNSAPNIVSIRYRLSPYATLQFLNFNVVNLNLFNSKWHSFLVRSNTTEGTIEVFIDGRLAGSSIPSTGLIPFTSAVDWKISNYLQNSCDYVYYERSLTEDEIMDYHFGATPNNPRMHFVQSAGKQYIDISPESFKATMNSGFSEINPKKDFTNFGKMTWVNSSGYMHVLGIDTTVLPANCMFEIYAKASTTKTFNIGKSTTANNLDFANSVNIGITWTKIPLTQNILTDESNLVFKPTSSFSGNIEVRLEVRSFA